MVSEYQNIIEEALNIRDAAYTPYSKYRVGAALLCADGNIYLGCNIENGAYSPGVCAERVAFLEAVKKGERDFKAIAVVAGTEDVNMLKYASPCGVCRQVMAEFCKRDFKIILPKIKIISKNSNGKYNFEIEDIKIYTLDEILPFGFKYDEFA